MTVYLDYDGGCEVLIGMRTHPQSRLGLLVHVLYTPLLQQCSIV